jgi:hypothetical protein
VISVPAFRLQLSALGYGTGTRPSTLKAALVPVCPGRASAIPGLKVEIWGTQSLCVFEMRATREGKGRKDGSPLVGFAIVPCKCRR